MTSLANLPSAHPGDPHYVTRSGWLRATVLGATDGIVSVSSIIVGTAPKPQKKSKQGMAEHPELGNSVC
jgi:VIT1/CCC1 family predicted Fe2+/Mn2+ transporter